MMTGGGGFFMSVQWTIVFLFIYGCKVFTMVQKEDIL